MNRNRGIQFVWVSFAILNIMKFASSQVIGPPRYCQDDLPRRRCVPGAMTLVERSRFLHNVNTLRNIVAGQLELPDELKVRGVESLMERVPGGAADMEMMHWDEEKALRAQKWANKCRPKIEAPDRCASKEQVYANIFAEIRYTGDNETHAMDQLFLSCLKDIHLFSHNHNSPVVVTYRCFDALVWGESDSIGCGKVFPRKGRIRLVCSLNPCCWPRVEKFTQGEARTKCKHPRPGYSERYPHLCATTVRGRNNDFFEVSAAMGGVGTILICVFIFLTIRGWNQNT